MRKILSLAAVLALAACGGGGGGATGGPTNPQPPQPTTAPLSNYVTPQFVIVVPSGKTGSSKKRAPNYVSSATLSVQVTLTADSLGIPPGSISGNPATTTIAAGTCNSGCPVSGPPSPPGTDSFTIVTFDNAVPATGHALNAGQVNNVTITAGQNNPQTVTLGAIPVTLVSIDNVPQGAFTAGTQNQSDALSITTKDGHGDVIPTSQSPAVKFVDATGAALVVTLTDPDANLHGTCLVTSGTSPCTTGAATSVTFTGPDDTRSLAYDGLAENPVTLTASAPGTAGNITASTYPTLNAPVFNGSAATPAPVAQSGSAEIDLFATSGIGSTGTESFTESGWTNSVYNHALTFANGTCTSVSPLATALSQIATVTAGTNSTTNGTPFTAAAVASPVAGSCSVTISDGLSLNSTDGSASLLVTYTTSSVSANAKHRHN